MHRKNMFSLHYVEVADELGCNILISNTGSNDLSIADEYGKLCNTY